MSNTSVAAALLPLTATFYRVSEFSLLFCFFAVLLVKNCVFLENSFGRFPSLNSVYIVIIRN